MRRCGSSIEPTGINPADPQLFAMRGLGRTPLRILNENKLELAMPETPIGLDQILTVTISTAAIIALGPASNADAVTADQHPAAAPEHNRGRRGLRQARRA
jgi:hypothetical protein